MYGLETIREMNKKKGQVSAKKNLKPYVLLSTSDVDTMPPFPFPNFGTYRPKDWKLINTYFVDSSGWGSSGEMALTVSEFKQKLRVGFGYAIVEAGQFQVYVGEFKKVK
jgi:hypothetical protein